MRLKTLALAFAAALLSTSAMVAPAQAQIEVDVNRGDVKPLPIAIPVFGGAQGAEIAQVIAGDLEEAGGLRRCEPDELGDAIRSLLADPEAAAGMATAGRRLIRARQGATAALGDLLRSLAARADATTAAGTSA